MFSSGPVSPFHTQGRGPVNWQRAVTSFRCQTAYAGEDGCALRLPGDQKAGSCGLAWPSPSRLPRSLISSYNVFQSLPFCRDTNPASLF